MPAWTMPGRRAALILGTAFALLISSVPEGVFPIDPGGWGGSGPVARAWAGDEFVLPDRNPPDLAQRLVRGGLVILLRHAASHLDQQDQVPVDFTDCEFQRNLTPKGRDQARGIGEAFRRLGIPVGEVLASPYCRTRETAELAFGRVETVDDLRFALPFGPEKRRRLGEHLRRTLATAPEAGTNRVIISHAANLNEAVGLWLKPEGVALVLSPAPEGRLEVLARVAPEDWSELAPGKTRP